MNISGLKGFQFFFLVFSQFSPCLYAPIFLRLTNDALFTLSFFEICLLIFPYIYCKLLQKEKNQKKREYFLNEFDHRLSQTIIGVLFLFLTIIAMVIIYSGVLEFKSSLISRLQLPMKFELVHLFALGIVFGIINPVVEEIYWRVFLVKTYSDNIYSRLFINFSYCSYHFFVVEYIFGWKLGLIGMVCVFVLGLVLDEVKRRMGLIAAILLHMGVDFGVVMIFADLIFRAMGEMGSRTPVIFSPESIPIDFYE